MIGAEILARWHHPKRGVVGPGEFLSVIKKAGHMDTMTTQVLREAFSQTMCFFSDEKSFKNLPYLRILHHHSWRKVLQSPCSNLTRDRVSGFAV